MWQITYKMTSGLRFGVSYQTDASILITKVWFTWYAKALLVKKLVSNNLLAKVTLTDPVFKQWISLDKNQANMLLHLCANYILLINPASIKRLCQGDLTWVKRPKLESLWNIQVEMISNSLRALGASIFGMLPLTRAMKSKHTCPLT